MRIAGILSRPLGGLLLAATVVGASLLLTGIRWLQVIGGFGILTAYAMPLATVAFDRLPVMVPHARSPELAQVLAAAPLDDEPVPTELRRAVGRAWQEYLGGRFVSPEELKRRA